MKAKANRLTKSGYEKVKQELLHRKSILRREIANQIETARRMGDLSENAAYKAAVEDRTINEKHISDLENILANSKIVGTTRAGFVDIGSEVTVSVDEKKIVYKIVGAVEADPVKFAISDQSPIGAALIGKKVGDNVDVELPTGQKTFKIMDVV